MEKNRSGEIMINAEAIHDNQCFRLKEDVFFPE